MLSKLSGFIKQDVYPNVMQWIANIMPSSASRHKVSSDRCCLSVLSDKIVFVYMRVKQAKAEIVLCETYPYDKNKTMKSVLSTLVQQYDISSIPCSLLLQPDQYQLLQTESLPVAENEFQAAIRWKIKDQLKFPIDDAVIDHFELPLTKLPTALPAIMLVIAQISVLRPLCEQILASGLKLMTIDIPELTLRNLIAYYEQDEKSTALLLLKQNNTQLIVTQQNNFYFTRRFDMSLQTLLSVMSTQNKKELNQQMDKMALEVQRSFDYFQGQWRQPEPERILLGMEAECEVDVIQLLSERLNIVISRVDLNKFFSNAASIDIFSHGYFLPVLGGVLRDWDISHATRN